MAPLARSIKHIWAAGATLTPRSRTSLTASILHSWLNFLRAIFVPQVQKHPNLVSVNPVAAQPDNSSLLTLTHPTFAPVVDPLSLDTLQSCLSLRHSGLNPLTDQSNNPEALRLIGNAGNIDV